MSHLTIYAEEDSNNALLSTDDFEEISTALSAAEGERLLDRRESTDPPGLREPRGCRE